MAGYQMDCGATVGRFTGQKRTCHGVMISCKSRESMEMLP
jgi:hypothetical protein